MKDFYSATPIASSGQTLIQKMYGFFNSQTRLVVLMICLVAGLWRSGEMKGQTTIQVGTGTTGVNGTSTTASPNNASPYGINVGSGSMSKKLQIIYTPAQINAALTAESLSGGSYYIHSVTWDVSTAVGMGNPNMQGYTISMANDATKSSFANTSDPFTGTLTQVYSANTTIASATGYNTVLTLSSPFQWDGTSNLIVQVCYSVTGVGFIGNYGGCRRTTTASNQILYAGSNNTNSCSLSSYNQVIAAIVNARLSVSPATPCSGTPEEGTVSNATPCVGTSAALTISGVTGGSGYTYQWLQSDAPNGTYVNATGTSTNATYDTPTTLPYSTTYYKCDVTCTNSSETTRTDYGTVTNDSFLNCYCTGTYAVALGTGQNNRGIANVALNGIPVISNASSANGVYSLYTAASPVANAGLTVSQPYSLNVTVGSQTGTGANNQRIMAWIDYDQDGSFEASEALSATNVQVTVANAIGTINFTIPPDATPGTTRMRIRHRFGSSTLGTGDACTNLTGTQNAGGSGEIEDYNVLIIAGCDAPETSASASSASPINTTSVTLNWTDGDGDAGRVVVVRQGSAVNSGPVGGTAYSANAAFGSGDELGTDNYIVYNSNGSSASISNLLPSTTYHYEIFEYHSDGTCYQIDGHTGSFTTASCAPSTNATSLTYSEITNVSATANWVRGSGTHVLVVARLTATTRVFPAYNTTYTTNTVFGAGTGSAITGTGNFVVYNGTGTSVNVTGLSNLTGYTFDIYEYNASPNCYWFTTPLNEVLTTLDGTLSGGCSATVVRTTGGSAYTAITPAVVLNNTGVTSGYYQGGALNTPGSGIPIGFDFVYNDVTYTTFGLGVNGYIWFGSGVPSPTANNPISNASANLGGSGTIDGIISAAGVQITTSASYNSGRSIGYTLSGSAPNRVLKIQWKGYSLGNNTGGNCDFYEEIIGPGYSDGGRCDFQIILHENGGTNSNKIGIAYADMSPYCVDGNACSAQVGLRGADNTSFTNRTGNANGSWANTAGTVNSATCTMGNSNYISGNVLLTFTQALTTPPVVNVGTQTCPDLTVPLTAPASSSYQWFLNGNIVPGPGSSAQTLDAAETGDYTVVTKTGTCYLQSDANAVTIASCGPIIDTEPQAATVGCTSGVTTISVEATGADSYQWQISTNGGGSWNNLSNGGKYSGATTATLNITNATVGMAGYQYQVIVYGGAGSVTSTASTLSVQVCPPNDNPQFSNPSLYSLAFVYPNNYELSGSTEGATVNSATGTRDVWYQFTAMSNGARIIVSSTIIDPKIYLFASNDLSTPLDVEDVVSGTSTEMLNYGNLIAGNHYRIAVCSSSETDGSFNITMQNLRKASCGSTGPFSLCTAFLATATGATNTTLSFTEGANPPTSVTTTGPIVLSHPALQLAYNATYTVGLTANYHLQDGAGTPEVITVPNPSNCSITIGAHPLVEVKSNMRCSGGATLLRSAYLIGATTTGANICGITGYRVEFTPVSNCAGDNPQNLETFTRVIAGSTASISLSYAFNHIPLAGNPNIGYWSVRWRPIYSGVEGTYGPARVIGVNGTSPASMMQEPSSDAIASNPLSEISFGLYPNPNTGELVNLNLTGVTSDQVFVRIMDAMGRVVYINRYAVEGSLNTVVNFNKPLTSGLYLVEFTEGNNVITQRMMVSK